MDNSSIRLLSDVEDNVVIVTLRVGIAKTDQITLYRKTDYFPRSPRMYGTPNAAGEPSRLRMASREPITSTMTVNA
jgi:hypothetical protein